MRIYRRHAWSVDVKQARRIQEELASLLIMRGRPKPIKRVAGADVSYSKNSDRLFAAVVVMDMESMEVVEKAHARGRADFPYIPGYLAFREGPILIRAFRKLGSAPDVVIFDGQGICHPRGMGIASHLGPWLEVATIGCAKSRLVGEHSEPGARRASRRPLLLNGRKVGCVLRTRNGVKPVYVSAGHRINLDCAVEVVMKSCAGFRLPEPVRRAHIESKLMRKEVER